MHTCARDGSGYIHVVMHRRRKGGGLGGLEHSNIFLEGAEWPDSC